MAELEDLLLEQKKCSLVEIKRTTGIEPASSAWKAEVIAIIPQSHYVRDTTKKEKLCQQLLKKFFLTFILFYFFQSEGQPMDRTGAID